MSELFACSACVFVQFDVIDKPSSSNVDACRHGSLAKFHTPRRRSDVVSTQLDQSLLGRSPMSCVTRRQVILYLCHVCAIIIHAHRRHVTHCDSIQFLMVRVFCAAWATCHVFLRFAVNELRILTEQTYPNTAMYTCGLELKSITWYERHHETMFFSRRRQITHISAQVQQ